MNSVLHQATIPSVPRSIRTLDVERSNIDATLSVLMERVRPVCNVVVYAASSSAYRNTPTLPKREDMPTTAIPVRPAEARR